MEDAARYRIEALDDAYRRMKSAGGSVRIAWQEARIHLMSGAGWDDLSGDLIDEAKRVEARSAVERGA